MSFETGRICLLGGARGRNVAHGFTFWIYQTDDPLEALAPNFFGPMMCAMPGCPRVGDMIVVTGANGIVTLAVSIAREIERRAGIMNPCKAEVQVRVIGQALWGGQVSEVIFSAMIRNLNDARPCDSEPESVA